MRQPITSTLQWVFAEQWETLKTHANELGILIIATCPSSSPKIAPMCGAIRISSCSTRKAIPR